MRLNLIINTLAIAALLAVVACASDASKPQAPPSIPPAIEAKFWRAQTQFMAILPDFQAKETAVKQVRAELDKVCGDKHQLADQDGLKCVLKPEPAKEATKK
jgi:outer membrane biogenesis lipoprotein LolB